MISTKTNIVLVFVLLLLSPAYAGLNSNSTIGNDDIHQFISSATSSANTESINSDIGAELMDKNRSTLKIPGSTTPTPITNQYYSTIEFSPNTIDSLLISQGYEPIGSTTQKNVATRTETVRISNPFGISVSGCGTVSANLEETVEILLAALDNAIGLLPKIFLSNISGFPDLSNPKEVFNYVYDMSTTIACQGTSAITTAVESAINTPATYFNNLAKTVKEEETNAASDGQLNSLCQSLQRKDSNVQDAKKGENLSATGQTQGDAGLKATTTQNALFQKCKIKYEKYKEYINEEVMKMSIFKDLKAVELQTSCDILRDSKENDPQNKKALTSWEDKFQEVEITVPNPFYLIIQPPEIFSLETGSVMGSMEINANSKDKNMEIIVDKDKLLQSFLGVTGSLPYYSSEASASEASANFIKNNNISPEVYDIGTVYSNIITSCIQNDKKYSKVCDDPYFKKNFPIKFSNKDRIPSLLKILKEKKLFCDITIFNEGSSDFQLSSIGLAIYTYRDKINIDYSPNLGELNHAISNIVIDDFCDTKMKIDIDLLEMSMLDSIDKTMDGMNQDQKNLLSASVYWKAMERYIAMPILFSKSKEDVVKICDSHRNQKEVFIATESSAANCSTASIKKIEDCKSSGSEWISSPTTIRSISTRKKAIYTNFTIKNTTPPDKIKESQIESGVSMPFEIEMKCDKKPAKNGDTCEKSKLSCGINFDKKTQRSDELYSPSESDGKYAKYAKKQLKDNQPSSEYDFAKKITSGVKIDVNKIVYFSKNKLSPASLKLHMMIRNEIRNAILSLK